MSSDQEVDVNKLSDDVERTIASQPPLDINGTAWRIWDLQIEPGVAIGASVDSELIDLGFPDCTIYPQHALSIIPPRALLVQINLPVGAQLVPMWPHAEPGELDGIVMLNCESKFRVDGLAGFDFENYGPVPAMSVTLVTLVDGFPIPDRIRPTQPDEAKMRASEKAPPKQIDRIIWGPQDLRWVAEEGTHVN